MTKFLWRLVAAVLLICSGAAVHAGLLASGEAGSFTFTDTGYFADKPIAVHYYKARSAGPDARVLIAVHGMERDARRARDNWQPYAEKHRLVVLAPEFDNVRFPARLFNMANLEDRDRSHWTFQVIEHLFDHVRAQEQLSTLSYLLFGHSAGGQFVQRFMLFTDNPQVSMAVAANAGSYTLAAYSTGRDDRFPYGLDERIVSREQLKQVFARRLVVLQGEADTSTDVANLPRARQAQAQGANRWERGHYFFDRAQAQAKELGVPLAWQLASVPGVGHQSAGMSKAAAPLLLAPDTPQDKP